MVYKKYSWRHGKNVSAEEAGRIMEAIEERDGVLTKKALLDEARPEASPIHKAFEWNDGIAAEKFRLEQARFMIQDIVVTVVSEDREEKAPAFVNVMVKGNTEARYTNVKVAVENDELRRVVLANALKDFEILRERYKHLAELELIFREISAVEMRYGI